MIIVTKFHQNLTSEFREVKIHIFYTPHIDKLKEMAIFHLKILGDLKTQLYMLKQAILPATRLYKYILVKPLDFYEWISSPLVACNNQLILSFWQ